MIICNYCRKEIRNLNVLLVLQLGQTVVHLHADADRQEEDCAGKMRAVIDVTQGDRPNKTA